MSSIDDFMGFDPSSLEAFKEKPQSNYDENVYKTNPKDSKSDTGNYFSTIKLLYNPNNPKKSIQHQATYWCEDADGGFLVKSKLGNGDKTCPIFCAWKKLHFSGDESKKAFAKEMFQKTESNWVLVQILADDNKPELVGQFKFMKLPQAIYDKMVAKMNPAPETKKAPVSVMDYLVGPVLAMQVQPGPDDPLNPSRKQREISYTLCDFEEDATPIISTGGSPLFTEEELETIETYAEARKKLAKAKTDASKIAAQKEIDSVANDIKELYKKALDYVKQNAPDLEKECGFQEWDANTTKRVQNWIDIVLQGKNPKTETPDQKSREKTEKEEEETKATGFDATDPFAAAVNESSTGATSNEDDDLPF